MWPGLGDHSEFVVSCEYCCSADEFQLPVPPSPVRRPRSVHFRRPHKNSDPIRPCRIVVVGLPALQPHMAVPHTSGAITRLAKRAEMARAEPGSAAHTMAGTNTWARWLSADAWLQHHQQQLLLHNIQHTTHTRTQRRAAAWRPRANATGGAAARAPTPPHHTTHNCTAHITTTALHTSHYARGSPPWPCLLYTSPSPRDKRQSRMPSSA